MIKAVLRFLGIGLITLIIISILAYLYIDKPLPEGRMGQDAEILANEMLRALNKPAYDSIAINPAVIVRFIIMRRTECFGA